MQFDEMKAALGLDDQAECWRSRWDESTAHFDDADLWVLDASGPDEVAYLMRLPEGAASALAATRGSLAECEPLRRLLWHCAFEIMADWSDDFSDPTPTLRPTPPIDKWPMLPASHGAVADLFYLFIKGMVARRLRAMHAERGIDEAVTRDCSSDALLWLEQYQLDHGRWGLEPRGWILTSLAGQTIRLGRLQYAFDYYHKPFDIFRHKQSGQVIAIAEAGQRFRRDGQFDGATEITDPQAWVTDRQDDDNTVVGFAADAKGNVQRERVTLRRDEWTPVMSDGAKALSVHIPAMGPMDPASCDASLAQACAFFPEHFPDWDFKAFTCNSWLMDSQLADHLKPQSNIVRFLQRFVLLPHPIAGEAQTWNRVFGCPPPEGDALDALPQDNSVQRALVTLAKAGGKWRYGGGVLLPEDVAGAE